MKVLVIDPVTASIRQEEWTSRDFKQLYLWTRCRQVERVAVAGGRVMWVDEEGLLKDKNPQFFAASLFPQPIAGAGVLCLKKGDDPEYMMRVLREEVRWGLLFNPHGEVGGNA